MISRWTIAGLALTALAGAAACGDKKQPLLPDNNADPLMLDAGGAAPSDSPAATDGGEQVATDTQAH